MKWQFHSFKCGNSIQNNILISLVLIKHVLLSEILSSLVLLIKFMKRKSFKTGGGIEERSTTAFGPFPALSASLVAISERASVYAKNTIEIWAKSSYKSFKITLTTHKLTFPLIVKSPVVSQGNCDFGESELSKECNYWDVDLSEYSTAYMNIRAGVRKGLKKYIKLQLFTYIVIFNS